MLKIAKKVDFIIRIIFIFIMFELFIIQLLIHIGFITTVVDFAMETAAILIYNVISFLIFLIYNLLSYFIYKLFNMDISKTIIIYPLIISTIIIALSCLFL